MTLQMRPADGSGPVYSPARDWAYNYPAMIKAVARAFNKDLWPEVVDVVAEAMNVSTDDAFAELRKANDAYAKFLTLCALDSKQKFADVLTASGWNSVASAAQVGYLAMLGQVMTGQLFSGLRDVTQEGHVSPMAAQLEEFVSAGLSGRCVLNKMCKGDDLKVDLAVLIRLLRNEQTPWEVIDTIIRREKVFEGRDP